MAVTNPEFNPSGSEVVTSIKVKMAELGALIERDVPPGRRRSIALTHLETASMYAVKAAVVGDSE